MSLAIQPLEEADIPACVRVELEAFRTHPRIPMLYSNGHTPDLYAFHAHRKLTTFRNQDSRMFKLVNKETGKIVACSAWTFALEPNKTAESVPIDPDEQLPPNYPEGANWAITRFFKDEWEKWRRETLAGRPYILLGILVVDPASQSQEAGKQLLSWVCEQADKLAMPIVLESTPAGPSLYERFGFEQVRVVAADMKQFDWHEPYDEEAAKRFWMIRDTQAGTP